MARVPYLNRQDATDESVGVWDRLEAERRVPTGDIFRALVHTPVLLDAFLSYANALRDASKLSPKLRELAILAVGHAAGSEYEVAHHQAHGRKAGLTEEQLAAVANFHGSDLFDDLELAVMRMADESTRHVGISDETWKLVAAHLSDEEMVELVLNIAWYNSGVRIMGMLDIELEESYRAEASK